MKIKPIILVLIALLTLASCKQAVDEPVVEEIVVVEAEAMPDYAAFDEKVAIIRTFMNAHGEENLALQTEMVSDTLKWSPPNYNGNAWLGKADYLAALKSYHDDYESIKFTEGLVINDTLASGMWSGSVYPQANASVAPDAIRVYGTWTAKHTASGKEIGVKWFGLCWINDDGKIVQMSDYFDVHGLAAQVAKK